MNHLLASGPRVTLRKSVALRVAAIYAVIGVSWVLLSDIVLYRIVASRTEVARLETAKGWAFVFVSAVAIYFAVRGYVRSLQGEEAKGRAILNCISDGVLLVGPDTHIADANPAAVRMLGARSARELIGIGPEEFSRRYELSYTNGLRVPPGEYVSQRALRGEPTQPYRAVLRRPDGTKLVIASSAAAVRRQPGGPVIMSVSVMRDVTRAFELEKLRDQLFAAAAHSLKTPLAVIRGHAQLMRANGGPSTARSAEAIDRQARRVDCLIQNLLVLARLRSGTLRLHRRDVDLAELVAAAVREERESTQDHPLRPLIGGHPIAFVDEERMDLAVRDLIEAACARARPGSEVRVSLRREGALAAIRAEYPPLQPEVDGETPGQGETSAQILEEIDEHTGLRVGRHVLERIAAAHGGSAGIEHLGPDIEVGWVRVPVVAPKERHARG